MREDHFDCDWDVWKVGILDFKTQYFCEGIIELEFALFNKLHDGDGTEAFVAGGDSEHGVGVDGLTFLVFDSFVVFVDLLAIFLDF